MTYVIYSMMMLFFTEKRLTRKYEIFSYVLYALLFNLTVFFDTVPIVYFVLSFTADFMITLIYKATFVKRVFVVLISLCIMLSIELLVNYIQGYYISDLTNPMLFESTVGITLISILTFMAVLLLGNFKNLKLGIAIPWYYWLSMIIVPGGTIIMLISIVAAVEDTNSYLIIFDLVITLLINIIVFYMYDRILQLSQLRIEHNQIAQQNKSYRQQLVIMQESSERAKSIRHDLKNHLGSISQMVKHSEIDKAVRYIDNTLSRSNSEAEISATGNLVIDSNANYKLYDLLKNGVTLKYKAILPPDLPMSDFDLTIILGNIFDNAIEALRHVKSEREKLLNIFIRYDSNRLLIRVKNSFDGKIYKDEQKLLSRKLGIDEHGIGLKNIETIVKKYNGSMTIKYDADFFNIDVILFCDSVANDHTD